MKALKPFEKFIPYTLQFESMKSVPTVAHSALMVMGAQNHDTMNPAATEFAAEKLSAVFEEHRAIDPAGNNYATWGFTTPHVALQDDLGDTLLVTPLTCNNAVLIAVEHRERVLPSSSIQPKLRERVKKFEDAEGRPATRKEIAILKDDVISLLIATAPIRPTVIPVIIVANQLYVFSSSPNKCDDVLTLIRKALGSLPVVPSMTTEDMDKWAVDVITRTKREGRDRFWPMQYAKLVEPNVKPPETITVKDADITEESGIVASAIDRGLEVVELDVKYASTGYPSGNMGTVATVRVSEKGIIKKFALDDIGDEADSAAARVSEYMNSDDQSSAMDHMAALFMLVTGLGHLMSDLRKAKLVGAYDEAPDNTGPTLRQEGEIDDDEL